MILASYVPNYTIVLHPTTEVRLWWFCIHHNIMLDVVSGRDQGYVDHFASVALDCCYHAENYSVCKQGWIWYKM